ncbi:MAG: glycoside hydrolase family 127 protein [Muribaculaceae bacterium]|nr:glycoside hydrolase family 127 protein [Muribaculaceae bacterium]
MNCYKILSVLAASAFCVVCRGESAVSAHGYPITPVSFTSVKVDDPYWSGRLESVRTTTIPLAFSKCEESGRYDNFVKAAHPSKDYKVGGFPFDDTDVYKTIEGASYLLQISHDPKLEAYIDSVLTVVATAQEPDGYLNTSYTMNPQSPHNWMSPNRWEKVEQLSHEFYNLGHMIDGAVAHYQATGKRNFLDIAIRYADCVCREIGQGENQVDRVPGHQIAEMALARLYLVTGDRKYLDQAKYFLDRRGYTSRKDAYSQAHKPVVEQDEAVGHAVRAGYMYAGMADVAALTGDTAYIHAIDRIWDNIVSKKYYITGGVGARHNGEAFGANYELPNHSAYCETCAAIANVYVNQRLFLLHGDAKYYDVLERSLYNGVMSGISLAGDAFFYPNPLASDGGYSRKPWFGCACCPSNLSRFLPSIPGYIYATDDNNLYVNLYIGSDSQMKVRGKDVHVSLTGDYIGEGQMSLTVKGNKAGEFAMRLRVPGWTQGRPVPSDLYAYKSPSDASGITVSVNGKPVDADIKDGYVTINRKWKKGDRVDMKFDMTPKLVVAHEKVAADRDMTAVERGPLVYCAEWPDNDTDLSAVLMNLQPNFSVERSDILNGVNVIEADAQAVGTDGDNLVHSKKIRLRMIPYYAWANRGEGKMRVWLPSSLTSFGRAMTAETEKNVFED